MKANTPHTCPLCQDTGTVARNNATLTKIEYVFCECKAGKAAAKFSAKAERDVEQQEYRDARRGKNCLNGRTYRTRRTSF